MTDEMAYVPIPAAKKRKGGNPWQRQVHAEYLDAHHAWHSKMENETSMYDTEVAEYKQHTPPPRYKEFLTGAARPKNEEDYHYHMGL